MTTITASPDREVVGPTTIAVGADRLQLSLTCAPDRPVALAGVRSDGLDLTLTHLVPVVQVLTVGEGHTPATGRLDHTTVAGTLRYAGHDVERDGAITTVRIRQDGGAGLRTELHLQFRDGIAAVRSHVRVSAGGDPVVLLAVPSWSMSLGRPAAAPAPTDWQLVSGRSDWLAEQRWRSTPLSELLPAFVEGLTGHDPRGAWTATATGTWSTGGSLPVGVLTSTSAGAAWAWQIEHNGPWACEVARDTADHTLTLSGPTDRHAAFSQVLAPGEGFSSVPVAVALGTDLTSAVAALTAHRRATRRPHPDNHTLGVVFNDYMNTLDGDPTTERLLPLIDAAAEVGAEYFCIDAGWYDDSGDWWPTVGQWRPSTRRFPGGLGEVIDRIHARGMVPGLWIEPEVIGVSSPLAEQLPDAAFLSRHGRRVVEHARYHLDLRHPAARGHVDEVVDRLVAEFGVGYFKLDYNIDPGPGTDHAADSPGAGLLAHNRAVLDWFDAVLDRHPGLVLEHCSSGAMRADPATLARLAMQSSSDQQDPWSYPPIAAAGPMSFLPEQNASWAYPQPGMDQEEMVFCLVTGLLGRFYLSGYLNRMTPAQRDLVAQAVRVAKSLRTELPRSTPFWPTGLPGWTDPVVSLGLAVPGSELVSVWLRGTDTAVAEIPQLAGRPVRVETVFPAPGSVSTPAWTTEWQQTSGRLLIGSPGPARSARVLRLVPDPPSPPPVGPPRRPISSPA